MAPIVYIDNAVAPDTNSIRILAASQFPASGRSRLIGQPVNRDSYASTRLFGKAA